MNMCGDSERKIRCKKAFKTIVDAMKSKFATAQFEANMLAGYLRVFGIEDVSVEYSDTDRRIVVKGRHAVTKELVSRTFWRSTDANNMEGRHAELVSRTFWRSTDANNME